jgi:hypothetical protein
MSKTDPTTSHRSHQERSPSNYSGNPADLSDLANADARIVIERRALSVDDQPGSSADQLTNSEADTAGLNEALSLRVFLGSRPTASVSLLAGASDESAAEARRIVEVLNWDPAGETPQSFRWHRSHLVDGVEPSRFFAIVRIEFDEADHHRQRHWVDQVLTAISAEPDPIPGLVAAHFLTSVDGTLVINLANWVSESEYDRALAHGPDGIAQSDLPEWQQVINSPGVVSNTVDRCELIGSQFSALS